MRILILSYYFPPDLSAGSFRCKALAKALQSEALDEADIEIITTTPNRYDSYAVNAQIKEELNNSTVYRCSVGNHGGSLIAQCLSFLAYALAVKKITAKNDYDFIVATSGRLMTAVLGAHIAKKKQIPIFLDIRDVFTESIQSVVPIYLKNLVPRFFGMLERYTINSSNWINLVSPGFLPYFQGRFPSKNFHCYTNGIDEEFLEFQRQAEFTYSTDGPIKIVYAGNIGDGQGLDYIIPQMALAGQGSLEFLIVGDGSRKSKLETEIKKFDLRNVELTAPVSRSELLKIYNKADVLFIHLNMFDAFNKVLPSKIFEYAATGKPILAGVEGFPKRFILDKIRNAEVFTPGNLSESSEALSKLKREDTNREEFVDEFSRQKIMKKMARSIYREYQKT